MRRALATLPTVDKTTVYHDHSLKGFGLKVTPTPAGRKCRPESPTRDGHTSTKLNPILAFRAQTLKADPSTPLHA